MSAITRPVLRYYGGKFRLAPRLIELFPAHHIYTVHGDHFQLSRGALFARVRGLENCRLDRKAILPQLAKAYGSGLDESCSLEVNTAEVSIRKVGMNKWQSIKTM